MFKVIVQLLSVCLYAAGGLLYLFTFGMVSVKNRDFIRQIACYLGFDKNVLGFKTIDMEAIIPEGKPISMQQPQAKDGNVTLQELFALNALIKKYNPQTVFEIGTFNGRTTLNFAANVASGSKIYTLDLPAEDLVQVAGQIRAGDSTYINKKVCGELYLNTAYASMIQQLYGDSAKFDFGPYANKIDMVFVDGAHSYDYVVKDTESAIKMVGNRKGMIIWHDAIFNEVAAAIHDALKKYGLQDRCVLIKGTALAFAVLS